MGPHKTTRSQRKPQVFSPRRQAALPAFCEAQGDRGFLHQTHSTLGTGKRLHWLHRETSEPCKTIPARFTNILSAWSAAIQLDNSSLVPTAEVTGGGFGPFQVSGNDRQAVAFPGH